jgi:hypothetical protein
MLKFPSLPVVTPREVPSTWMLAPDKAVLSFADTTLPVTVISCACTSRPISKKIVRHRMVSVTRRGRRNRWILAFILPVLIFIMNKTVDLLGFTWQPAFGLKIARHVSSCDLETLPLRYVFKAFVLFQY